MRKILSLAVGEGVARVLGVAVFAGLARILPITDFGVLTFAMSFALLASVVVDMGQNAHIGRVVARSNGELAHAFSRVAIYKVLFGGALTGAMALTLVILGFGRTEVFTGVWFMGWGTVLSILDSLRAILRALDRMAADSLVNGLESAARALAVVAVWALDGSVVHYAFGFTVEAVVALVVTYLLLSRTIRLVPRRADWERHGRFLREAAPIGWAAIATAGFYRIDQVFILPLAGSQESALYGAAARVVFTLTVAATLIASATYPRLCRLIDDRSGFARELRFSLALSIGAAGMLATGLWVSADAIVGFLYGDGYEGAVIIVRILSGVIALNGVTAISLYSANALHRERRLIPTIVFLGIGSVIANLALVESYGAIAAAWISVVGELLLAIGLVAVSVDRLWASAPPWSRDKKETLAC